MAKNLADVALNSKDDFLVPLDWVGMQSIEVPVRWQGMTIPAKVDAQVRLEQPQRGIHMSRLYMAVQKYLSENELSAVILQNLCADFLQTHADLSSQAKLKVRFELPLQKKALVSENQSWRQYPIEITVLQKKQKPVQVFVDFTVTYSSTCPASAALSRQLIQEQFLKDFVGGAVVSGAGATAAAVSGAPAISAEKIHEWLGSTLGIVATPHAQRSTARVKLQWLVDEARDLDFMTCVQTWIFLVEEALKTPVQGAVKRVDEQAFALLNGQNLMFCEDAARRLKKIFLEQTNIVDYVCEVQHLESLHPHNATCRVSAGKNLLGFDAE
ncbi:MAG: GTP cyclohydrolase FolE2 [Pseudobdellovibrionaceae bacterium]